MPGHKMSAPAVRQRGYTLMEIVVVMAIVGMILGGVSVGRGVMQEAEYNRLYNKFLLTWKQAYDLYYQRVGTVVGDNQVAPTLMVNGYEARLDNSNGAQPGIPSSYLNTGRRICHGSGYARNSVGSGDPALSGQNLHDLFDRVGIDMPAGRAEGQEDRYLYEDSNGNPVELQVCFQWNPARTISGAGNVMVVRGLTPDLARKIDTLVDGKPDAIEGRFRQQNSHSNHLQTSSQQPGHEWTANNTYAVASDHQTAQGDGGAGDEDRVVLLTAHWIMDQ